MSKLARRIVPAAVAVLAAATALSGTGTATAASRAVALTAPVLSQNGLMAYSCKGYAGTAGHDGWILSPSSGPPAGFEQWTYGQYDGGVGWAPDGSEMVHDASVTKALYGHDSQQTVFLSESNYGELVAGLHADFDYPWQDTNYRNVAGPIDTQTSFTADGKEVLFTRTQGGAAKIEQIPAAGWDPPIDLAQPAGSNSQPSASVSGDVAFVNLASSGPTSGTPWVWILPSGSTTPVALQPGSLPRFSPDGTLISYVNGSGTLSTMTTTGTSVTAAGPTAYPGTIKDYAWSPDGTTFAFGLAIGNGGIYTAPVAPGSALTSVPTTLCSVRADQVSWQPVPATGHEDQVVRVWGSTRENTSVAVSKAGFSTPGTADAVVLADSYHFPDALSGAPLATFVHGPLLLTPGTGTTALPAIKAEMGRVLGSTSKPVYILGGTGSVSAGIQADLVTAGYTNIVRLAGANRYLTSLAIANFMGHDATAPEEILLATGTDFPDGLSAGAAAASYWPGGGGGAVLLTNGSSMVPQVQTYLTNALKAQTPTRHVYVTVVGGLADKAYPGTASNPKYQAVGADRYETSAFVAELHFGAQKSVAVATGTSYPDALSGGAYAGSINAPLLLLPPSLISSAYEFNEVPYFLNAASGAISTAYIFGGTGVVNTFQRDELMTIIGVSTVTTQITPSTVLTAKSRALTKIATTPKAAPRTAPRTAGRG